MVKWTEEPLEPQATTVEVKTRPFHRLLQHATSEIKASRPKTRRKTLTLQSNRDVKFLSLTYRCNYLKTVHVQHTLVCGW